MNTLVPCLTIILLLITLVSSQSSPPSDCPSLFQKVVGSGFYVQKVPIPQPNVTIDFDTSSMNFNFGVNATYIREDTTWVIDFAPWNFRTRQINQPTNCENRESQSYNGVNPNLFWTSASHARSSGALGTLTYLAYGPSNRWSLGASSCDSVYYRRSFSFSDLLGCRGSNNEQLIQFESLSGTSMLQYNGSLFVTAVSPIWRNSATKDVITGYETVEFVYPFSFKFGSLVNDVVAISATNNFNVRILNIKINEEKKLVVTVRTELQSNNGDFLFGEQVARSNFPVLIRENVTNPRLTCSLDSNSRCNQEWILTSRDELSNYNSPFTVLWALAECSNPNQCDKSSLTKTVTSTFSVTIDVVDAKVGQNDFKTKLTTHNNINMQAQFSGPFKAGDRIFVKDQLSVQVADADRFTIRINNAWICFPTTSSFVPRWDPSKNLFGCSSAVAQFLPSSNIVQLVKDKIATRSNPTELSFDTSVLISKSLGSLPYFTTVAFSFLAQPLAFQEALYFIHVETEVTQTATGKKRTMVTILQQQPTGPQPTESGLGSQGSLSPIYVDKSDIPVGGSTTTSDQPNGGTQPWIIGASAGGVGGLLAIVLLCCFGGLGIVLIVRHKRNKKEQQESRV